MADESVIDKLKKIRQLALRGSGGEKDAAKKILDRFMEANALTENDLVDEETAKVCTFPYDTELDKKLFLAICTKVFNDEITYKENEELKEIHIEATVAQQFDIQAMFGLYKRLLEEEMKVTFDAFVFKNRIYPSKETVFGSFLGGDMVKDTPQGRNWFTKPPENEEKIMHSSCSTDKLHRRMETIDFVGYHRNFKKEVEEPL